MRITLPPAPPMYDRANENSVRRAIERAILDTGASTPAGLITWGDIGDKPTQFPPTLHHLTHQALGVDEMNVVGLHGQLADPQTPLAHPLVSGFHTAAGLTTGHVLRATGPTAFDFGQMQYGDLGGVPATFPPAAHTHPASDITPGTFGAGNYVFPNRLTVNIDLFLTRNFNVASGLLLEQITTVTPSPRLMFQNTADALGNSIYQLAGGNLVITTGAVYGSASGTARFQLSQTGAAQFLGTLRIDDNVGIGIAPAADTRLWVVGTVAAHRFGYRLSGTITSAGGSAVSAYINATMVATANADALFALRVAPTFTIGAFTGTAIYGLNVADITGGATSYAIYTGLGQVRFGDALIVASGGITVSAGGMSVIGPLALTGNLTVSASAASDVRWRETSQVLPLGLWSIVLSADNLFIRKNTAAAGDFSTQTIAMRFSATGAIIAATWNGTLIGVTYGGTGSNLSATGPGVLKQNVLGGNITVSALAASDIGPGTFTGAFTFAGPLTVSTTTQPQLVARYDAANRLDIKVSNIGEVTFDAVGTAPAIVFIDTVYITGQVNLAGRLIVTDTTAAQATLRYDPSNLLTITVANDGLATFLATGAVSRMQFTSSQVNPSYYFDGAVLIKRTGSNQLGLFYDAAFTKYLTVSVGATSDCTYALFGASDPAHIFTQHVLTQGTGILRVENTGASRPTAGTGKGIEFQMSGGNAFVSAWDVTAVALFNLRLSGAIVTLSNVGNVSTLSATAGAVTIIGTVTASSDRAFRSQASGNVWAWGAITGGALFAITEIGVNTPLVIDTGAAGPVTVSRPLNVSMGATIAAVVNLLGNGVTATGGFSLQSDGANNAYVWNYAAAPMYFGTSGAVALLLAANGQATFYNSVSIGGFGELTWSSSYFIVQGTAGKALALRGATGVESALIIGVLNYSWPTTHVAGILRNNGTGTLTWATSLALTQLIALATIAPPPAAANPAQAITLANALRSRLILAGLYD